MPRTRSAATPPPRRSGADRPRSVRGLTHRPPRPVKPVRKAKVSAKQVEIEQPEELTDELPQSSVDFKQALIQRHAAVRAEHYRSGFGAIGMLAVVATCVAIFAAWWFLPDVFGKPAPIVPPADSGAVATSTVHFAPVSATSTPATVTSTPLTSTSTERRLLLPLTPSTSTKRLK